VRDDRVPLSLRDLVPGALLSSGLVCSPVRGAGSAAGLGVDLTGLVPDARASVHAHLSQAVLRLKLAACRLGTLPIPKHVGDRSVLMDQVDRQMDVVVAVARHPVTDRHPPQRRLLQVISNEPHPGHELLGDLGPLIIGQPCIGSTQRQRAMPHMPARHIHAERPGRGLQILAHRGRVRIRKLRVTVPGHLPRTARHQMRIGVLVTFARAHQILDEPDHVLATPHVRDHDRPNRSISRSTRRSTDQAADSTASV